MGIPLGSFTLTKNEVGSANRVFKLLVTLLLFMSTMVTTGCATLIPSVATVSNAVNRAKNSRFFNASRFN